MPYSLTLGLRGTDHGFNVLFTCVRVDPLLGNGVWLHARTSSIFCSGGRSVIGVKCRRAGVRECSHFRRKLGLRKTSKRPDPVSEIQLLLLPMSE